MKVYSDIQFKYTCNHNQVDTCCHVTVRKFVSHYPVRHLTTDHHLALVAERSKALTFLSWTGDVWVRIPLETHIFILIFSLPPRSEQVNGAVANEIKHVHSPEVIVVLDPRYD